MVLGTQQALCSFNEWVNAKGTRVISKIPTHTHFLWFCGCLKAVSQMGPKCLFAKIPRLFLVPPFRETKMCLRLALEKFLITTGYRVKQLAKSSTFCWGEGRSLCLKEIQSYVLTVVECKCMKNGNTLKQHQRKIQTKWRDQDAQRCSAVPEHLQQTLHLCTQLTKWSGLTLWFWGPGCQSIVGVLPVESPLKGWMRSPGEEFWFLLPSISKEY